MKKIVIISRQLLLLIVLSISLLLIVGCKNNKDDLSSIVVSSIDEFNDALRNNIKTVNCNDITFEEDTIIQINYCLTIRGNNSKTTLKNAHFQILGPNVSGKTISVSFENIILDGGFYTNPTGTDKTFEDIYGSERDNLRCITSDWGYNDLTLSNVDILGYASAEGSALYSNWPRASFHQLQREINLVCLTDPVEECPGTMPNTQ